MSEARDDGGAAFPYYLHRTGGRYENGMTLRDYFAAKAMQGVIANSGAALQSNDRTGWGWVNCNASDVAVIAYQVADAMLKARSA
jgi:hypothetical protein